MEEKQMMSVNLFKKIIDREISADIVFEDDECLAFRDINPQAPTHVLIIPKKEFRTHDEISDGDRMLLGHLHVVAKQLAEKLGLSDGYRLVVNCKEKAGQTVPHLHVHLLGGREFSWPPG
jgi:histidine triad (HIT) family protein